MDQQRLILSLALSVIVLIAWQELVLKRYEPEPSQPVAIPEEPIPPVRRAVPAPVATDDVGAAASGPIAAAPEGDEIRVETDVLRAVITSRGARLASLQLKSYRASIARDAAPLEVVGSVDVLPLTLQVGSESDAGIAYVASRSGLTVTGSTEAELVFEGELPDGRKVRKAYIFHGNTYVLELATRIDDLTRSERVRALLTPIATNGDGIGDVAIGLDDRRLEQTALGSLEPEGTRLERSRWAGFASKYFLLAAVPSAAEAAPAVMRSVGQLPIVEQEAPILDGEARFLVYAGPKDEMVLAAAGHELDRALDFGWFWFVAVPLLHGLRLLNGVLGNYGVSIIVLTVLIKVATIPLTRATFRNMREMQKIQPQMAKLRERFKGEPQALQKEMMELYRRHRVNPFSGCLPMLLQLPIFVGLYNTLSHAIELRHAPFALWIGDLSAPDRLMVGELGIPVLTLLMGASMFLQQWLTPAQGDPSQQRIMMFMPLIFTFMFINFPAGLVLYWLVNNVLTIGQQWAMLRSSS